MYVSNTPSLMQLQQDVLLSGSPERSREAQRDPERSREAQPRQAQRRQERPRQAQTGSERPREAQRSPREAQVVFTLKFPLSDDLKTRNKGNCICKTEVPSLASLEPVLDKQ